MMNTTLLLFIVGAAAYLGSCVFQFRKFSREDAYTEGRVAHTREGKKDTP